MVRSQLFPFHNESVNLGETEGADLNALTSKWIRRGFKRAGEKLAWPEPYSETVSEVYLTL